VLVVPLMVDLPPAACTAFTAADIAIWSAFAVDYGARLYLAPARWRFVRSHPLDLLVLVVPFLKPLRAVLLLRLARLGVVTGAAQSRAQRSLHATAAVYVITLAAGLMVLAAAAMYDVERRAPAGNIKTIPDALWWRSQPSRPSATATATQPPAPAGSSPAPWCWLALRCSASSRRAARPGSSTASAMSRSREDQ